MVLMAIDHVRVYAGVPAGGPEPGVFFTRWVTHFCAPIFVFFAGTSAFFYARKHPDLRRFLLTRGMWLILLELTFLRVAWTFNFDFMHYEMAGVIWVLGWSMVFLAILSWLPTAWVGAIGVAVIAGHNLLDHRVAELIPALQNSAGDAVWKIVYVGFWAGPIMFAPEGPMLIVLYSLIPWVGVMAAGYAFGCVLAMEPARRDRACGVVPRPARFQSLRRSAAVGRCGGGERNPTDARRPGFPQHHQVPRVVEFSPHDAGAHDRVDPAS
jgi:uncharacterized membrane protein